jgi:hypothetical protein
LTFAFAPEGRQGTFFAISLVLVKVKFYLKPKLEDLAGVFLEKNPSTSLSN